MRGGGGGGAASLELSERRGSRAHSASAPSLSPGSPATEPRPLLSQHQGSPAEGLLWDEKGPGPRKGEVLPSPKDNSREPCQGT